MKVTLRFTSLMLGLMLWSFGAWAQPINDDCVDALNVVFSANEANVVVTEGDTRGGTASTEPTSVCSGSFYTDDIWFKFTTPDPVPTSGVVVRVWFDNTVTPSDVVAIGMAVYNSCDINESPLGCFSSQVGDLSDRIELTGACLLPNHIRGSRLVYRQHACYRRNTSRRCLSKSKS